MEFPFTADIFTVNGSMSFTSASGRPTIAVIHLPLAFLFMVVGFICTKAFGSFLRLKKVISA